MYKEEIPRNILIAPDNILGGVAGDNIARPLSEQGTTEKRVLQNLVFSGNMLGRGRAVATFYEPDTTSMVVTPSGLKGFSGLWLIGVDNETKFIGYMTNVDSQRTQGGSIRTYTFTDVLQGWDVLLTNKVYPTSTDSDYTVHDLLNDIVYGAISISGIPLKGGHVPDNSTLLSDLYEEGVYSVVNSTYLSEIQKICQDLGYLVFCDPAYGDVTILDPFNIEREVLDIDSRDLNIIDASFSMDYLSMASTVLANDDITLKGIAHGKMGTGDHYNTLVYDLTRINNLAFATTFGVKEEKLGDIAELIYKIGKNQSRVLSVTKAGDISNLCLGATINWSDSKGGTGNYTVFEYETTISMTEYKTVLRSFVSL